MVAPNTTKQGYAAAVQLKDGKLLVTGGYDSDDYLNTSEMLTEQGWQERALPPIPVVIGYHCIVQVNATTVMAIAGNSFILNLTLPNLKKTYLT